MKGKLQFRRATVVFTSVLLGVLLASSGLALQGRGEGGFPRKRVAGVLRVQRVGGSLATIDFEGIQAIGVRGHRIIIDLVGAGVVREGGQRVEIRHAIAGPVTARVAGGVRFDFEGTLHVASEGEPTNAIIIDVIGAGIVFRRPDQGYGTLLDGSGHDRVSGDPFYYTKITW